MESYMDVLKDRADQEECYAWAVYEIERLREAAKDRPKDRPNEAADEIEKLKGALLEIKSIPKQKRGSASYAMAAIAEAALKEGE